MSGECIDPHDVLGEYDLGTVNEVAEAGGTAGKTWKVRAKSGDYLLRLRGVRTSAVSRLRYDHGLRDHLVVRGIPTASAVRTRKGATWVTRSGRVLDLYMLVVGRSFRPESNKEMANAAHALAEFHEAAATYQPELIPEQIDQYTTLGFSDRVSSRMDDPGLQKANLHGVRGLASDAGQRRLVDRCISRVEGLMRTYAGSAYERLIGWVIHGDYTPANLLFSEKGEVVGVFDLDWAMPGTRCRDIADALYYFAARRHETDSSDIWMLTEAVEFDPERMLHSLRAYEAVSPLAPREIEAIPRAFGGRWLSVRLEGMAKVGREERFRFFSRDIEEPLNWLDEHWPELTRELRSDRS